MNDSIIITLVHGTFAKNASWVQKDSFVQEQINEYFKGKNIIFPKFRWSGSNSNKKRHEASQELLIELKGQLKEYPDNKKFIIAHSHAGNISLYALRELGTEGKNFNLITMSTPFLNKYIRDYQYNLKTLQNIYIFFFGVLSFLLLSVAFICLFLFLEMAMKVPMDSDSLTLLLEYFGFLLFTFPATFLYVEKKIESFFLNLPDKIADSYKKFSFSNIDRSINLFITYDKRDEVKFIFSRLLNVWETIFFILDKILQFNRLAAYITLILVLITLGISFLIEIIYSHAASDKFLDNYGAYYAILVPAFIITAIFSFIIPFIIMIFKSNPIMLGWEDLSHKVFIGTVPAPKPKTELIEDVRDYQIKKQKFFNLWHSIYTNKSVINDICAWIQLKIG